MHSNLRRNLVMNYGIGEWRAQLIRKLVNQYLVQQQWNLWLDRNTGHMFSVNHAWLEKVHSKTSNLKRKEVPSLYKINMDSFSSSVKSAEGYLHAVVFVDNSTGYHDHWFYGMKNKDETFRVVKQCYSYIADLQAKDRLVVFMLDRSCEKKSKETKEFF